MSRRDMVVIGWILVIGSLIAMVIAWLLDVSVSSGGYLNGSSNRVVNLDMMRQQFGILLSAGFGFLSGVVLLAVDVMCGEIASAFARPPDPAPAAADVYPPQSVPLNPGP